MVIVRVIRSKMVFGTILLKNTSGFGARCHRNPTYSKPGPLSDRPQRLEDW